MPLPGWSSEEVQYIAERGYQLYREGRLHEASLLFQGLVVVDPENVYCRKALAAVSIGLGQHWLAIRHLNEILVRSPRDVDTLARRCEALMATGDFPAAQRDFAFLAAVPAGIEHAQRLGMRLRASALKEPPPTVVRG